ncbi:MAG: CsgG/HfaB family protein [Betaproteobacteria bacterium]
MNIATKFMKGGVIPMLSALPRALVLTAVSVSLMGNAAPAKDDKKAARMSVTIYEMRSSVTEIPARAATDMFTTALVKTRKFRVVERQRIGEGVARERDLNAQGITTGKAATKQVHGAGVIFEATISEVTVGKTSNENSFGIGGLQLGGSSASDGLGIDVRVLDASTGEVLDAVNVRKSIKATGSSVGGVGTLVDNMLALKGKSTRGFTPDVANKSSAREGIDEVLRDLIEDAVKQLSSRSTEWDLDQ